MKINRIGEAPATLAKVSQSPYLFRMASPEIEALTNALARLPGLGPRSARRAVLHLLKKREAALSPLLDALAAHLDDCTVVVATHSDAVMRWADAVWRIPASGASR